MRLDDWVFRGSHEFYDRCLQVLATKELPPEKWSRTGSSKFEILRNYITRTFERLYDEMQDASDQEKNKFIYQDEDQACFNTGLFDKDWQPIYFYCRKSRKTGLKEWIFKGFYNSYTIRYTSMPVAPALELRRPNYFLNPGALIFDVKLPIIPQWEHILGDEENFMRIPEQFRSMGKDFCQNIISGAIENVKKRIESNYKTAVPQWYRGRIQLLAPLYLSNPSKPDLALVLSLSENGTEYFGHTCLTMDMAYNNARLIARPDSEWLIP